MTWFAFQGLNSGKAIDLAGTQEKQAVGTGFHGYGTESEAEKQPNSVNFLTRVEADAFISDYHTALKQQSQPGGPNANITNPATAAKAAVTGSPVGSAISSVEGFVSAFGNKTLWIRVANSVSCILPALTEK
jgi:putative N-acetylmannosamine-6-phosphate epimerase